MFQIALITKFSSGNVNMNEVFLVLKVSTSDFQLYTNYHKSTNITLITGNNFSLVIEKT